MEKQTCGNCAFYSRHYIIKQKLNLVSIECGHCTRISLQSLHKRPSLPACDLFEPLDNKIEISKSETLLDTMRDMQIKLEKLLLVLKN